MAYPSRRTFTTEPVPTQQPAGWASRAVIRDPSAAHQIRLSKRGEFTGVSCNCLVTPPRQMQPMIAVCLPGDLDGMLAAFNLYHDGNGVQV